VCKLHINYTLQHIIGGVEPGFIDGTFEYAQYDSLQGVVFHSLSLLNVDDTENCAIRKVTNQVAYIFQPCVEFLNSVFC